MHYELYISLCIFYIYYLLFLAFFLLSIITASAIYIIKAKRNHATGASSKRD